MVVRPINLDALARQKRKHSIFAPSSAHRWLRCAGSLIPNLLNPEPSGYEAAEGTVAHMIAEQWQRSGVKPKRFIGTLVRQDGFDIEVTRDMIDYVQEYRDWCERLDGDHYIEQRVDLSQLFPIPNQGGHLDHAACVPGVLTVTDLKFGKQIRVFAKRNPQLMLYALGKYFELNWLYSFKKIVIRVAQPRQEHFDVWECDVEELLLFAGQVMERARLAWSLSAPRTPSDEACAYCAVAATCGARLVWLERLLKMDLDGLNSEVTSNEIATAIDDVRVGLFDVDPPSPADMTLDEMGRVLKYRLVLNNWLEKMMSKADDAAVNDGAQIPEHKLVESQTRRKIAVTDDELVAAGELIGLSREDVLKVVAVTPTELERVLEERGMSKKDRDDFVSSLVVKPRGRPTLAPITDRRREYCEDENLDGAFENYDAEDL